MKMTNLGQCFKPLLGILIIENKHIYQLFSVTKTEEFNDSFSDQDSGNDSGEPSSVNVVPLKDGENSSNIRRVTGMVKNTGLISQGKTNFAKIYGLRTS